MPRRPEVVVGAIAIAALGVAAGVLTFPGPPDHDLGDPVVTAFERASSVPDTPDLERISPTPAPEPQAVDRDAGAPPSRTAAVPEQSRPYSPPAEPRPSQSPALTPTPTPSPTPSPTPTPSPSPTPSPTPTPTPTPSPTPDEESLCDLLEVGEVLPVDVECE